MHICSGIIMKHAQPGQGCLISFMYSGGSFYKLCWRPFLGLQGSDFCACSQEAIQMAGPDELLITQ